MPAISGESIHQRLRALPELRPLFALIDRGESPRIAVVGGAVRDLALGQTPTDIDLVLEGALGPLAEGLGGELHAHGRFETATVTLPSGGRIDLARARTESYPQPGALPVVSPASLEVDLIRRDFTVNAIAVELSGARAGQVLAAPEALEDLDRRRLAVLHKGSFNDDPTRLLRLARYHSRLGFQIAPATRAMADDAVAAGAVQTLSGERIGRELMLSVGEPDPAGVLEALAELGLPRPIARAIGLKRDDARAVGFKAEDRELLERAQGLLPSDGRLDLLALAVLTRRVSAETLSLALGELGLIASDRDTVFAAATRGEQLTSALGDARAPSAVDLALSGEKPETVALTAAGASDELRDRAMLWLDELRQRKLAIDGNDLVAAGIEPGPTIGAALAAARAALLDGNADDRAAQLKVALQASAS